MSLPKKILFLTGTRADFGKLKPLFEVLDRSSHFQYSNFVTGMHLMARYGYTVSEVYRAVGKCKLDEGFRGVYTFMNHGSGQLMERVLADTISGLSLYTREFQPDMVVIHGDRVEALAGAIVGAMCNILVAHIEGGELSGTIDELIRHSVTKMSHLHFVSNKDAARRLIQLGERKDKIFVIGSPDIDVMLSKDLPSGQEAKEHYNISFETRAYGVLLFHPVTTDQAATARDAESLVSAVLASNQNFLVIYPNNDDGCESIFLQFERLSDNPRMLIFPSIRFECFLSLLKDSACIVGNSSAGIREAPVFGVPSINISNRQKNRFKYSTIFDVKGETEAILQAIEEVWMLPRSPPSFHFGAGNSARRFLSIMEQPEIWDSPRQKQFIEQTMTIQA